MIIGIPKEIKDSEHRVGMTPSGVESLVSNGHKVYVQKNAGLGSGFKDNHLKESAFDLPYKPNPISLHVEGIIFPSILGLSTPLNVVGS